MKQDYFKEFKTNLAYHFSEVLNYPFAKPCWIFISLSHKCTYNCQMCGVVKILKGRELSTEIVKNALDEIYRWDWGSTVVFTGGEPFLRKDIFDLIACSAGKGIKTEIVSNGSLIDKEMAQRIISSGLSNIAISLDGARQFTHDFVREKGSFSKAISAIELLVKEKRARGKGPQISIWTTIMKENAAELFDIVFLARDLGIDCLVYHPVVVAQDDMQNTSPDAPFWIRGDNLNILKEQIDKITEYKEKHGLVVFLHNPYLWIEHFKGSLGKKEWKCNPFVFMNVGPDGEMRSCGDSFGNIKTMSIEESLRTQEANKARELMKSCQKPCLQTCWAHPESDSLIKIVNNFCDKLNNYKPNERRKILKKALDLLCDYQGVLKKHV